MDESRLWVHQDVVAHLFTLPRRPWEVGGWLLGYWKASEMVVTHATPPAGRGTPFGVTISGRGHRARFDEAWDATEGTVTFLGDWHTHPRSPAIPSRRDRRAAKTLADDPDFGTPHPIIAIVATGGWPRQTRVPQVSWFVRDDEDQLIELDAMSFGELPPAAAAVPAWQW